MIHPVLYSTILGLTSDTDDVPEPIGVASGGYGAGVLAAVLGLGQRDLEGVAVVLLLHLCSTDIN